MWVATLGRAALQEQNKKNAAAPVHTQGLLVVGSQRGCLLFFRVA